MVRPEAEFSAMPRMPVQKQHRLGADTSCGMTVVTSIVSQIRPGGCQFGYQPSHSRKESEAARGFEPRTC